MRSSGSARAVSIRIGTWEVSRNDFAKVEAGFARHHHVEHQQIEGQAVEFGAGFSGVLCRGDAITFPLEKARQQIANAPVIVDHQQMRAHRRKAVRRCAASHVSLKQRRQRPACRGASAHARRRPRSAPSIRRSTSARCAGSSIATRKRRTVWRSTPGSASARAMSRALQMGEPQRQGLALRSDEQQPLAAVSCTLLLHHITFIDKLLEHPAERLLGDPQDVEQFGNLHARIAVDEMQHPMMGAAEAELA